MVSSNFAAPN